MSDSNKITIAPLPGGAGDSAIDAVAVKVEAGERLTREDGIGLFQTGDLMALGALANGVRERLHGNKTYYNINRHLNYTNICVNRCRFCSFSRNKGQVGAWEYSLDEIFDKADSDLPAGATELHIVGGLHPDLPLEFYLEMLRGLKQRFPKVHLKAFTAVEIDHLAKIGECDVETVLARLIEAGLGSLPGGGAEVFAPDARKKVCGEKIDAETWIAIHHAAHRSGLRSNCTLLYGHVETVEDRVDHLIRLRALQDETGGFQAFIPLAFHPAASAMSEIPGPTGVDDLKVIAVARLMLDNIPHIKAYWISLGIKTAQVAQAFGADDLDGTVVEETIHHMAGSAAPQSLGVRDIERLIVEAGRTPVQRDSLYREIDRGDTKPES